VTFHTLSIYTHTHTHTNWAWFGCSEGM